MKNGYTNSSCETMHEPLSRFIDSDLSPKEADALNAHLQTCTNCRNEQATLLRLKNEMRLFADLPLSQSEAVREKLLADLGRSVRTQSASSPFAIPSPLRRSGWAVLAAATVAGVLFLRLPISQSLSAPSVEIANVQMGNRIVAPAASELSLLFDLHDAQSVNLTGEDPLIARTRAADAHSRLIAVSDETFQER